MRIVKAKEKEALVLFIIIFAIILIGYYQLLIMPKMRALDQLSPKVARLRQDVESAKDSIANIDSFKRELAELSMKVGNYEAKLPTRKETALFLGHLSRIAKESGAKIVEIMELKKAEAGPKGTAKRLYDEVLIDISMRAGYHQLGRFINKVETQAPLMKVHDIQIKADSESPMEHNVKLIVSALILE